VIRVIFAIFLAFQMAVCVSAQTSAPKAAPKAAQVNDIFSGTVTASSPDSVTVVRKVPAKPDESKSFVIDKDTKIEGKLKVNSRVSVRFRADDDGTVHENRRRKRFFTTVVDLLLS
jgi:hypothetical protein